ncbi:conserved hypothetical protein [Histoplasma capsulatum var. duboisii H88]|uniref:Uncharacterized protein n=2 Tax=Ajellomyces capsulatus TaxID=5037 RepID=F0UCF7_AJEC8|nr:conserved hypothetical protein [Histoplasma capsulatum var. duboisii H88]QSS49418.1 hypothetical protein I7I53_09758 [Histoplasma capsulatum var. duboisii H88]
MNGNSPGPPKLPWNQKANQKGEARCESVRKPRVLRFFPFRDRWAASNRLPIGVSTVLRTVSLTMLSHKGTRLFGVVAFFAIFLLILSSTPSTQLREAKVKAGSYVENLSPNLPNLAKFPQLPKLPGLPDLNNLRLTFSPPTHKPPEQTNSTSGESKWYSDWKWLNPFSSSITLDENRSVLPPLALRRPVFTFYNSMSKKQKGEFEADRQLLLTWRRAWWAKGFRPIVLGPSEAANNRRYRAVKTKELSPELEADFMKWLAWGNIDSGLLVDWRCFPMAEYEDRLLASLRGGSAPEHITRLENLGTCLFSGERSLVNDAIEAALQRSNLKDATAIIDVVPDKFFRVEKSTSLAYYDPDMVARQYSPIAEKIKENPSEGKLALVDLINLHLQTTFQNTFASGIAVTKPFPEVTTVLVNPAVKLAGLLAQCPPSMLQSTCPPNNLGCTPCTPKKRLKILQPSGYLNNSAVYTLGVLPHPYTLLSLQRGSDNITVRYIRRETDRDRWLIEATKILLGENIDSFTRAVPFKSIVAGRFAMSRSLWFTVESFPANPQQNQLPSETIDDLDWHFGFRIPRESSDGNGNAQKPLMKDFPGSDEAKIRMEFDLIEKARKVLKSAKNEDKRIKDASEAWNLVDTEVWRFVRAFRARSVIERKKWEEEEKGFAGS